MDVDERLIVWYTPAAIKEHYDSDPDNVVHTMTNDDLARIGSFAVIDERTWKTFNEVLDDAVDEVVQRKDADYLHSIGEPVTNPHKDLRRRVGDYSLKVKDHAEKGAAMEAWTTRKTTLRCVSHFTPFTPGDLIEANIAEDDGAFYLRMPKQFFAEDSLREQEIVEIELDAHEPEYLLGRPALNGLIETYESTPEGVWFGVAVASGPGGGNPVMRLRGPRKALRAYVVENWGRDTLEQDGMEVLD
jgi:hypothetical protein